ncbi:MAG TPA: hypothetical protein VM493_05990 [Vicinamibacterales bacterium]|nr:hypothetical protein [Vicinamibacterales bacterium]
MSDEYRNFKAEGEGVWFEVQRHDNAADQIDAIRCALEEAYKLGRADEAGGYDPDAAEKLRSGVEDCIAGAAPDPDDGVRRVCARDLQRLLPK